MSYLRDNKNWDEEDNINWDIIEISKVDDKIIQRLINNLKLHTSDLSENFFISFESLLKLGKKIEPVLDSYIKKTIEIVKKKGAVVNSPIFTIGNFTGTEKILDLDVVSVISERGHLYEENDCPMCKSGSKAVSPRIHWDKLKNE